jgi:hypothetical protein
LAQNWRWHHHYVHRRKLFRRHKHFRRRELAPRRVFKKLSSGTDVTISEHRQNECKIWCLVLKIRPI